MIFGKVPPQASELEMAILGAIIRERDAYDRVQDILRPECFYLSAHQQIFTCMRAMAARGMPLDELTLVEELIRAGQLEAVGGAYYVTKLTNAVVTSAHIEAHARIVLQKFIGRELIRIGGQMVTEGYEDTTDVFDLLDKAESDIYGIANANMQADYTDLAKPLVQEVERIEKLRHQEVMLTGVPSGYPNIDKCTSGWQPTDLIILAARPSVGKTAFALNLVRNAEYNSIRNVPVGFFSLEMSKAQLVQRMLAAESGTYLSRIRNARFDDDGMKELYTKGINRLAGAKIYIDDTAALNMFQLRSKARRMKSRHKVGLIIIDYLQLMTGDSNKSDNREREISKISRELKKLAKDLELPIIALSQLSRHVERRAEAQRVPVLADLRESGAIEQDADLVMFLYRPSAEEINTDAGLRDAGMLKIAKHRSGQLEEFVFRVNNDIQLWTEVGVAGQLPAEAQGGGNWKPVNLEEKPVSLELFSNDMPF